MLARAGGERLRGVCAWAAGPHRPPPPAPPARWVLAGAFGWVQHARNKVTGEEVAVKFIELGPRFYQKYVEREVRGARQRGGGGWCGASPHPAAAAAGAVPDALPPSPSHQIINHRLLAHPHIVAFKEVFITDKVWAGGRVGVGLASAPRARQPPAHSLSSLSPPPPPPPPQHLAIVMEYVGGGNLQQFVERAGRLPEWQARCFFQQLILALHHCHQARRGA